MEKQKRIAWPATESASARKVESEQKSHQQGMTKARGQVSWPKGDPEDNSTIQKARNRRHKCEVTTNANLHGGELSGAAKKSLRQRGCQGEDRGEREDLLAVVKEQTATQWRKTTFGLLDSGEEKAASGCFRKVPGRECLRERAERVR